MPDDYPDNNSTTGLLWFNYPGLNASLETPGDVDWFYYPNTNPAAFVLTNAQFDLVEIIIRDANGGAVISSYYGPAANAYINLQPTPQHHYHVSVQGFTAGGVPTSGTYTIAATNIIDDHPDEPPSTSPIVVDGVAATGATDAFGDWDCFRIDGTDGNPFTITLASAEFERVIISVQDQYGNTIATYSGLTPGASLIAPANAAHVRIIGFDAAGNYDTGTYSLVATSIPDDYGDTLATAAPITLGDTINGAFEPGGDVDWFAISLTAGQPLLITLTGAATYVRFYLANGDGTETDIAPVTQSGQLTAGFVADATGTYYIRVEGTTGSYTLNAGVSPYNPHDPANFSEAPENGYLTGYLSDSTDVAWYRVDVAAGETVSIHGPTGLGNLSVVFYDTDGNEVASAGNSSIRYITVDEASTFYIALTAPLGGSYNLQCIVGADDFADGLNVHGSNAEPIGAITLDGPAVTLTPNHSTDIDLFAITLSAGQSIEIIGPWWLGIGDRPGAILFYDPAGDPIVADFFHVLSGSMTGDTQSAGASRQPQRAPTTSRSPAVARLVPSQYKL